MLSSWLERQARVQAKELKKELARAAKQGNARRPSPAVPAQAQGKARKKAHTTRAAKQGNARPPSVRVAKGAPKAKKELLSFLLERHVVRTSTTFIEHQAPTKQLGMKIAFKGSPSAGGLLMPDDASDAASDVSDNEALGAASSSRPPSVSRKSPQSAAEIGTMSGRGGMGRGSGRKAPYNPEAKAPKAKASKAKPPPLKSGRQKTQDTKLAASGFEGDSVGRNMPQLGAVRSPGDASHGEDDRCVRRSSRTAPSIAAPPAPPRVPVYYEPSPAPFSVGLQTRWAVPQPEGKRRCGEPGPV